MSCTRLDEEANGAKVMQPSDIEPAIKYFCLISVSIVIVFLAELLFLKVSVIITTKPVKQFTWFSDIWTLILLMSLFVTNRQLRAKENDNIIFGKEVKLIHLYIL